MRWAAWIALLLLAACEAKTPPAPPSSSASGPAPEVGRPVASLAGEWRVAGIDGADFNESYGVALSADEREIWWSPRCAGAVRRYRIEGLALETGPALAAGPPPPPGSPPPPVCAIAQPPRLWEVMRALDAAERVERTPANGVLISGGGHSLTLFSQ